MEIGPGDGEQACPFADDLLRVNLGMMLSHRFLEFIEVDFQKGAFPFLALLFRETAAEEIGDILHSASSADILEIDHGDLIAVGAETEICQLGVSMDEG